MNDDLAALADGLEHECTFVEEQEPSGRLILGPCLSCGLPAMEAILGVKAIVALHAPDTDGNCAHCTRGRVYPVPAPCETVRALARGGEAP